MLARILSTLILLLLTASLWSQRAGQTYYIQSQVGNRTSVLGAQGGTEAQATEIVLTEPRKLSGQQFTLEDAGGGYYYIRSGKGLYLHLRGGTDKLRSPVRYWPGKGQDNTKWKFDIASDNMSLLMRSKTGPWVTASAASGKPGTAVRSLPNVLRHTTQQWRLVPVSASSGKTTSTATTGAQKTLVVKITGVRLQHHDGDCKKIHGSASITLLEDANCRPFVKPSSGGTAFRGLRDANTFWRRDWTQKKVAQLDPANDSQPSPNNHSFTQVYKVDASVLRGNAALEVKGRFQQCHKSGWSAGDYNCSVFHTIDRVLNLKPGRSKESFTVSSCSTDGCTHRMKIYIETSVL